MKKGELSTNNRQSAFLILWSQQENGVLGHGLIKEVADFFSVHKSTISRLWRATKNKIDAALDNQDGVALRHQLLRKWLKANRKEEEMGSAGT